MINNDDYRKDKKKSGLVKIDKVVVFLFIIFFDNFQVFFVFIIDVGKYWLYL